MQISNSNHLILAPSSCQKMKMTIFSHSGLTTPARLNKVMGLVTLSKAHQDYKGAGYEVPGAVLLLVYFITYDSNYMTSCLSSFFPVYNELTTSRQAVKHFTFQCFMSAKSHPVINSFVIYKTPANFTFPFLQRQDRKFITFTQSGTEIKNTSIRLAAQTLITNCNSSSLKIYGCEANL